MSEFSQLSDDDLMRLMVAGNEDALAVLYRRRQGAVYRFALQMTGRPSIAEEVTQEVFLTLICSPRKYDASRGPLMSWLLGIARNQVLRYLERDGRYLPFESSSSERESEAVQQVRSGDDVLEVLARRESLESVRQLILALPAHYREAVVLCDLQEMGYEEAARVLNCAVGTVRSRLNRGRALLLKRMRGKKRCGV